MLDEGPLAAATSTTDVQAVLNATLTAASDMSNYSTSDFLSCHCLRTVLCGGCEEGCGLQLVQLFQVELRFQDHVQGAPTACSHIPSARAGLSFVDIQIKINGGDVDNGLMQQHSLCEWFWL